jgi:hypothetical protein
MDKIRLTLIEMEVLKLTAGITFLDEKNEEIKSDLEVEPDGEKLRRCNSNWLRHATRMNNNRMPKVMLNFRPNGRRRLARRLKRLLDETGTGLLRPKS